MFLECTQELWHLTYYSHQRIDWFDVFKMSLLCCFETKLIN